MKMYSKQIAISHRATEYKIKVNFVFFPLRNFKI